MIARRRDGWRANNKFWRYASKNRPWTPVCYNLTSHDPASNTKFILFQSNGSAARITVLRSVSNILEGTIIGKLWQNQSHLNPPKGGQDCDGVSRNPIMIWLWWQHSITRTASNLFCKNDWHLRDPRKCDGVSGNPITIVAQKFKTQCDWFFRVSQVVIMAAKSNT